MIREPMRAILQRVAQEGPLTPTPTGGYAIRGKAVDRQIAFACIAAGFVAWTGGGFVMTQKGTTRAGLARKEKQCI